MDIDSLACKKISINGQIFGQNGKTIFLRGEYSLNRDNF